MFDNLRNFHFYSNGNSFFGDHEGMRFAIEVKKDEDKKYLSVTIWPEPYCREKTDESLFTTVTFEFSQKGLDDVRRWLTDQFISRNDEWTVAKNTPLV